jgi:hypothetical protein
VLTIAVGVYPGPMFDLLHPPVQQLLTIFPPAVAGH